MSSLSGQGPAGHERNWWDVFNPRSDAFHESEEIFHKDLSKSTWHWRQAVVVIASMIGALFFIVGAFPLFRWTVNALKPGENKSADKTEQLKSQYFPVGDKKREELTEQKESGSSAEEGKKIWKFVVEDSSQRKTGPSMQLWSVHRKKLLEEFKVKHPERYNELFAK